MDEGMKFHHNIAWMIFFYNNSTCLSTGMDCFVCLSVIIYTVHATTWGDWTQIPHVVSMDRDDNKVCHRTRRAADTASDKSSEAYEKNYPAVT